VLPFNEPARDLRIQNKPLWLLQRDVLCKHTHAELELTLGQDLPAVQEACLAYCDNLFFDQEFIDLFIAKARLCGTAVQAAFHKNDPAFYEHCLSLSDSYSQQGDLYLVNLWYFPNGPTQDTQPLIMDMESRELGYYHIPTYMAFNGGDLVYHVPLHFLIAIDSWVHVFIADTVFGLFGRGAKFENRLKEDPLFKLRILGTAMMEGKQLLSCSKLVRIGKNCSIDPSATIHGPTSIGDNVTIGAGAVIENCIIGSNVNISQGCNLMLSVVGDGTFLPFRASLFMTTIMDNSMVAQNTCLQMSVIGRNTFIGAGSTFTDFNLLPIELRARDAKGFLANANRPVLGGCVGHNCRIGAGMVVYPARTIESDVVLFSSLNRHVIDHDVHFEDSDHFKLTQAHLHQRLYPKDGEIIEDCW
jgi:carbonic anhydrase/acetyltransferase-like protein (isoleucine patch superfamily)